MSDVPEEIEVRKASLAAALAYDAAETTVVGDLSEWPTTDFEIKIGNEVIGVGARSGNTLSSLTRGPQNEGRTHPFAADVLLVLTGETLADVGALPDWWDASDSEDEFVKMGGSVAIGAIADYAASIGAKLALSVAEDVADGSTETLYIPGFGNTDIGPVGGLTFSQGSPGKQPGALLLPGSALWIQMPDADTFNPEQSLPAATLYGYVNNGVGENPAVDILQIWKDYTAGLAWGIGYGGQEWLQAATAPDDAKIASGQRWQWYDDTTGAPKLLIMEKDAAGTVFSRISATLVSDATAFAGISKPSVPTSPTAAQIATALATLGLVTLT